VRGEDYLLAAESGDVQRLRLLVQTTGTNQLEFTDQLGRTPIHLAVINEHKEVRAGILHPPWGVNTPPFIYPLRLGNDTPPPPIISVFFCFLMFVL